MLPSDRVHFPTSTGAVRKESLTHDELPFLLFKPKRNLSERLLIIGGPFVLACRFLLFGTLWNLITDPLLKVTMRYLKPVLAGMPGITPPLDKIFPVLYFAVGNFG